MWVLAATSPDPDKSGVSEHPSRFHLSIKKGAHILVEDRLGSSTAANQKPEVNTFGSASSDEATAILRAVCPDCVERKAQVQTEKLVQKLPTCTQSAISTQLRRRLRHRRMKQL